VNFNTVNWSVDQVVTVSAPADGDAVDNGATLTLTSGSLTPKSVVVTAVDTLPLRRPIIRFPGSLFRETGIPSRE